MAITPEQAAQTNGLNARDKEFLSTLELTVDTVLRRDVLDPIWGSATVELTKLQRGKLRDGAIRTVFLNRYDEWSIEFDDRNDTRPQLIFTTRASLSNRSANAYQARLPGDQISNPNSLDYQAQQINPEHYLAFRLIGREGRRSPGVGIMQYREHVDQVLKKPNRCVALLGGIYYAKPAEQLAEDLQSQLESSGEIPELGDNNIQQHDLYQLMKHRDPQQYVLATYPGGVQLMLPKRLEQNREVVTQANKVMVRAITQLDESGQGRLSADYALIEPLL